MEPRTAGGYSADKQSVSCVLVGAPFVSWPTFSCRTFSSSTGDLSVCVWWDLCVVRLPSVEQQLVVKRSSTASWHHVNRFSVNSLSPDEMSVGELSLGVLSVHSLSLKDLSVETLPVAEPSRHFFKVFPNHRTWNEKSFARFQFRCFIFSSKVASPSSFVTMTPQSFFIFGPQIIRALEQHDNKKRFCTQEFFWGRHCTEVAWTLLTQQP